MVKWNDTTDEAYGEYTYGILIGEYNGIYVKNIAYDSTSYWLASPWSSNTVMRVTKGKENATIDFYYVSDTIAGQLRPVVCLKTAVELKKTKEGTYAIK